MGGGRFRLSKMIPIAWFYKLKSVNQNLNPSKNVKPPSSSSSSSSSSSLSSTLVQTNSSSSSSSLSSLSVSVVPQCHTHLTHNRTSQYFKRDLIKPPPSNQSQNSGHDSPKKYPRRRRRTRLSRQSSPLSSNSTSKNNPDSPTLKASIFTVNLPPILTKTIQKETNNTQVRTPPENSNRSGRRLPLTSPAMKRTNKKKKKRCGRRESRLWESLAVVKTSMNPEKDFMESMVEMIMENEIKKSKDLEDLLVCYLQLNSNEYHDLIISAFKQIWLHVAETL